MTDTDIRDVLVRVTDDLAPPADLLEQVRGGGRRRVVRRRTVLAAGVVALGVAPAAVWRGTSAVEPEPAAAGDLGRDQEFLRKARKAWGTGADMFPTQGRSRVRWAGNTPGGPVALLSQPITTPQGEHFDLLGWVETVDGKLRGVEFVLLVPPGTTEPSALLVGEKREFLVLADLGEAVWLSPDFTIDAGGRIQRNWVAKKSSEGVSITRVAPQNDGHVRIALKYASGNIQIANLGELSEPHTTAQGPIRLERVLPGAGTYPATWEITAAEGYVDLYGYQVNTDLPAWYIRGDGLNVQTVPSDDGARIFWFLGNGTPHYAGLMGLGDTLRVRLPGPHGVVVALLNATFRYRAGGGAWLPASGDAVLLPAAARQVEVTPRGGEPFVIAV